MTPGSRWLAAARGLQAYLLLGLIGWILGITCLQIIVRNADLDFNLAWADTYIRVAVLWLGLIGAVAAAHEYRHIRIDIASRYLPSPWNALADALASAAACIVCGLLAWHGTRFVVAEREFSTGDAAIPVWVLQSIMPICFGLMAMIYLVHVALAGKRAVSR